MPNRALIIANRNHLDQNFEEIASATTDSGALAAILADPQAGYGFTVETLNDPVCSAAAQTLESFFVEATPDHLVWLHLIGHARRNERGEPYFAMADTQSEFPGSTGIAADLLDELMARSSSRRIMLTLDICYTEPHREAIEREAAVDFASVLDGPGRFVITAPPFPDTTDEAPEPASARRTFLTGAIVRGLQFGPSGGDFGARDLYDHLVAEIRAVPCGRPPVLAVDTMATPVILTVKGRAPQLQASLPSVPQKESAAALVKRRRFLLGGVGAAAALAVPGAFWYNRHRAGYRDWVEKEVIDADYVGARPAVSQDRKITAYQRKPLSMVKEDHLTNGEIAVREVGSWSEITAFPCFNAGSLLALNQHGDMLAVGGYDAGNYQIQFWHTGTGEMTGAISLVDAVEAMAFRPDGRALASCGADDGRVRIWDTSSIEEIAAFDHRLWLPDAPPHTTTTAVAFSPGGEVLAFGSRLDDQIYIADAETFAPLGSIQHSNALGTVSFSPDGQWLAVGSGSAWRWAGTVELYSMQTYSLVKRTEFDEPEGEIRSLAFNSDGSVLAAVCGQEDPVADAATVMMWNTDTYELIASFGIEQGLPSFLEFADDETLIVAGRELQLWRD
jgi:hypothetical protein